MESFFAELKRRNVVKVAVAYAVVAWLLIEVTSTVFPIVQLPDWTVTFVTMLLLLGFPVALILSWAYELTPDGIEKTTSVRPDASITKLTGRKLDFIIIGLLAAALLFVVVDQYVLEQDGSAVAPTAVTQDSPTGKSPNPNPVVDDAKSIAVMAFVNMSSDPEQEFFSDGIAEEILNGLAKVKELQVAARTSAFSFKGKDVDLREVGETLNVNHVLEGSVRRSGDRMRITAQLIKVEDGYHLWSETYDRELDDIFTIQEEIAQAVVDQLQVSLGLATETKLVHQGTDNTEAYTWYLRGRHYIEGNSPDAFEQAIKSYTRAIELDPEFAGGYGGLALGLVVGSFFYPYEGVAERVRAAYQQALLIDENQTEALLAKGADAANTDDYIAAEQAIRKALKTGGNKTLVSGAYWTFVLAPQRRFDEALALLADAEKDDPLSSLVQYGLGANLAYKRSYLSAIPYLETALELSPGDPNAGTMLNFAYVESGQFDRAKSAIQRLEDMGAPQEWINWERWYLATAQGDKRRIQEGIDQLLDVYATGSEDQYLLQGIGLAYARAGDIEEAINWLERAVGEPHSTAGEFIMALYDKPEFWGHPRMQGLLKRINLDDASVAAAKAAVEN